jgi:hypothetical protein
VSATGLTTGSIPYNGGVFQIDLDFINHQLHITTSVGNNRSFGLGSKTVAAFYAELFGSFKRRRPGQTTIYAVPNEVDPAIPFADNNTPCSLRWCGHVQPLAGAYPHPECVYHFLGRVLQASAARYTFFGELLTWP